jgi:peptide chain release factor 1
VAVGLELYEEMLSRHTALEAKPPAPGDPGAASYWQELNGLDKQLKPYREYLQIVESLSEARSLAEDPSQDQEFRDLAREELTELAAKETDLRKSLLIQLVASDGGNRSRAILEIRAGTGGEEAALFAGDLFRMYRYYCEAKKWKLETMDASPSDLGGFREVIFRAEGEGAFGRLRFEAGTHRVQRVPKTETKGRIHTSAATVAVMAEPEQVEIQIPDSDLEISVMRSSGPGGQSVNTTDSCVRIVHKPTGIAVKCMVEKSQHKNKAMALRILRARLLEAETTRAHAERSQARKNQIGTGDRSGRIRTYNFPQNRVTDHRLEGEKNFSLEKIVAGDLDPLIDRLFEHAAGIGPAPDPSGVNE